MDTEIDILEKYIEDNYKSKAAFAKALDMTPQNLNHHIRAAKKTKNIFSVEFKSRLHYMGFNVFGKTEVNKMNLLNDPQALLDLINSQKQIIELLQEKVTALEDKVKAPVVRAGKTGG